ncbi:MAG: patatin-like phospholipase family protein [Ignavibacteria bacterium]|nr:patatin-like phospholipase family protein [Ignavibacteria bacterium]
MRTPSEIVDLEKVIAQELEYIALRRDRWYADSGLRDGKGNETWGLAFSGGGIRSATFCLGVMQSLAGSHPNHPGGVLGRFDYLSTVSGGGYIGSALTTLLTVTENSTKQMTKVDCSCLADKFPFTSLNVEEKDSETLLSVKNQMHHLRRAGNYLSEERKLTSRYLQRFIGAATGGTLYNVIVLSVLYAAFVVVVHSILFLMLTGVGSQHTAPDVAFANVGYAATATAVPSTDVMHYLGEISDSAYSAIVSKGPWGTVNNVQSSSSYFILTPPFRNSIIGGLFVGLIGCVFGVWRFSKKDAPKRINEEQQSNVVEADGSLYVGESKRSRTEKRLLKLFNAMMVGGMAVSVGYEVFITNLSGMLTNTAYHGNYVLWLPMFVSLGALITTFVCSLVFESSLGATSNDRVSRSYLSTIRGNSISIFIASTISPILIILLFSFSSAPLGPFIVSVFAALFGIWATKKLNPADGVLTSVGKYLKKHPKFTIGLAALVALLIPFATMSRLVITLYNGTLLNEMQYAGALWLILGVLLLVLVFVTTIVDSNNISPFKFYRDRLSESYLKTAMVAGTTDGWSKTIRDDEDMRLNQLGDVVRGERPKAPYHLITACLNLATLKSLLRADTKSTHFLFSRNFIGSLETGYVRTPDETTVAEAIAISGAAASSMAGYHSSFGQRFFATLFNIRLGQWIPNPKRLASIGTQWKLKPIWIIYLMKEVLGLTSHTSTLINVSDGGHTGDNLGLLPLLKRRLDTIVVVDAECDPEYIFGSLNNAIRLANIEDNIEVDIDLSKIKPTLNTSGVEISTASVAEGKIIYPSKFGVQGKVGRIIYCKASVSETVESGKIPAHVENYNRMCSEFPHQSTGDQFFDPEQFEAYRALGAHVGAEAASRM